MVKSIGYGVQLQRRTAGKFRMQRVDVALDPDIALTIAHRVLASIHRGVEMQFHGAALDDGIGVVRAHDFDMEAEHIAVIGDRS